MGQFGQAREVAKLVGRVLRRYRLEFAIGATIVVLASAVVLQLTYPADRALPRARLAGQSVGGLDRDELVRRSVAAFESSDVKLKAGDKSATVNLSKLGATPKTDKVVAELTSDSLLQRLVPFWLLLASPQVDEIDAAVDAGQIEIAAEPLAKELSVAAKNAQLTIAGGELATTPASIGQTVTKGAVTEALSRPSFYFGTTELAVASSEQLPTVGDDDVASVRSQAQQVINISLSISAEDGTKFVPEPATIASWLAVIESPEGGVALSTDNDRLGAYIETLNSKVGVKPGTTTVTMVDGKETGRTAAPSGRAIAADELMDGIKQALFDDSAPKDLTIKLVDVPPIANYNRSYTASQAGLTAYVDFVTSTEDIRIAVSQIGGNGWAAKGRADDQLPAASTYKLYVAAMLIDQIKSGEMSWGDAMQGTDVAGCFERMIVVSDNPCAEAFVDMFGAVKLNNYLYAHGISRATTFISDIAAQTTAGDLEKILRGIEDGSIVSGSDQARLLSAMERQKYRAGVPAGSAGRVQDKVGFLWDYIHDAAIVRHPKGTYVIAVATKGSSWGRIADITREIERIMYS